MSAVERARAASDGPSSVGAGAVLAAAQGRVSIAHARAYVNGLEMLGMRLGLDRVRALAAALGDPQRSYRTIHIVGTNGKSSTARFLSSVLTAHGIKVGTYVSPHLVSLAERQLIDGSPADEEEFYRLVAEVMPVAAEVEATFSEGEILTQFEVLTAVAFLFFKQQGCEAAVIEAGLGGRWDATSIIASEVQVLTTVGLEHTELLGETLLAILEEKAAVIPPGGSVMAGRLDAPVLERVREICRERDAALTVLGEDVSMPMESEGGSFDIFGAHDLYGNLRLSVLGSYQRINAAVAVGAAELFQRGPLDGDCVRQALSETRVPGRLEVISEQPFCILDGAHNPHGMTELMRSLDALLVRRRLIAVVSILRDKGADEMLRTLAPRCDILFVTQNSNPRSYSAEELADLAYGIEGGPEVFIDPDPRSALRSAYRLATSNQVVVVTGSLYLISDLKRSLSGERNRA